jgi:hypothetical protein
MEKKDKYFKDIENKFQSDSEKTILQALHEIRQTGKPEIIPLMFNLLAKHKHDKITDEVFNILDQIKDKGAVPYVVAELELKRAEKYRIRLITSCWQSGLDYSAHLGIFSKFFVEGDYLIAIESFSVIEENIHNSSAQVIRDCREYLVLNLPKSSVEKKALFIELIKLVECYMI